MTRVLTLIGNLAFIQRNNGRLERERNDGRWHLGGQKASCRSFYRCKCGLTCARMTRLGRGRRPENRVNHWTKMQRHLAGAKFSLRFTFERTDSVRGVTSTFHCNSSQWRTYRRNLICPRQPRLKKHASFAKAKYAYDADNSNGMEE